MSKRSKRKANLAEKRKRGVEDPGAAMTAAGAATAGGAPSAAVAAPRPTLSKAAKRNAQKRRAAKAAAAQRKAEAPPQAPRRPKPKPPPSATSAAAAAAASASAVAAAPARLPVVYEDAELLAINKPAGLLCHPSPGFWSGGTVVHALDTREVTPGFSPIPPEMLGERLAEQGEADSVIPRTIVHRLDRGTTGLMVLAKTARAEAHLRAQFKARTTRKVYVALLLGSLRGGGRGGSQPAGGGRGGVNSQPGGLLIDVPIGSDPARAGRVSCDATALRPKPAQSVVHVHAHDPVRQLSLVTVELLTGRQHQIRAHCAHRGAPLANDEVYGGADASRALRAALGAPLCDVAPPRRARPLLHAWSLAVPHPTPGRGLLRVAAPLPQDLRALVAALWPQLSADDPASWPSIPLPLPTPA